MAQGTVKKVRIEGYGFISTQDTPDKKDIFFHKSSLKGTLADRGLFEGDKVTFNIAKTDRGLSAVEIKLVEDTVEETKAEQETEDETTTTESEEETEE